MPCPLWSSPAQWPPGADVISSGALSQDSCSCASPAPGSMWRAGSTRSPDVADWAGAAGGSAFPSGHTTTAALFAALGAWAIAARVHAGWPRRALWAGAVVYAVAVGWSRVWLAVHWPTDVIGGWLYGLAWFAGSIVVILTLRRRSVDRRAARLEA